MLAGLSALLKLQPRFEILQRRLLDLGGLGIIVQGRELHLEEILREGKPWSRRGLVVDAGEPSECHANASLNWERSEGRYAIVNGWALTPNQSVWISHSWNWDLMRSRIIETTVKMQKYYGYVLDEREASDFRTDNANCQYEEDW